MKFFNLYFLINIISYVFGYKIVHNYSPSLKQSVLFFPAKFKGPLPHEIYNDFLQRLSKKSNVYVCENNFDSNNKLINDVIQKHENLCIVSHSSSANDVIELSKNNDNIEKLILIDPIDHDRLVRNNNFNFNYDISNFNSLDIDEFENKLNNFLEADKFSLLKDYLFNRKNNKDINFDLNQESKIKDLLILKNKMSERWRFIPPIPPINYLTIDTTNIKAINKNVQELDSYGHFDILDTPWSNFMHKIISKGSYNRSNSHIEEYHNLLVELINDFNKKETDSDEQILECELID